MAFNVESKIALVTGANRGIGRAIVENLLAAGSKKVYLAVRNPASTSELESKYGERVKTLIVDMEDSQSIYALAEQASDVELLVNNAGRLEISDPLSDNAALALQKELTVNTFGLLHIAQAFNEILVQNHGALVQMNSVASMKNFLGVSTYSASKAASYAITQGLREQWAENGVQVLSVHPGPIATDMAASAGMLEVAEPADVVAKGIIDALAAGQFHLFPDAIARQFEQQYKSYAETIIEAPASE
ncbi:SDR family oxidoreductase [Enterovibrio norvegicus]|uniref:Short-chain dehydrogenase n=1 Tax=Enterovibrio norvegicus TaxID=188144 RepID=A0A2N7LBL3_9GAMM|nr:SDR family oxidoreductase [Enterovibrio norvegicus]PMN92663.1 short-chain dehydrogenase [Enterovibrio norvegicus]